MILEGDTNLTTVQYEAVRDATGDQAFQLTLEKYSLSLSSHDSDGHGSAIENFDAIVCNDVLVRAYRSAADTITIQTLATEDASDQSWSTVTTLSATGIDEDVPLSLAVGGDTVRVFYYDETNTQIEYFESTDKGTSWGASVLVEIVSGVLFLAASATTRVHYVTLTSDNNRRLHVAVQSGAWSSTDSEIYWQAEIDSFDAVVGNQADDGASATNDIIVFATDFPHMIGVKVKNTELVYTVTQVQGIATIRYQNGRWSDHYEFDVVDEAPAFPSRYDIKLSTYGDLLFMTYYRKDGTSTYSHTAIGLSRSKSGIYWELPYLLQAVIDGPTILLKRGDHAYLLNSKTTYRSLSCGYTGDAQVTQDLTDYAMDVSTRSADIQEIQVTLANPQQALDNTSPLGDDCALQLKLELGYHIDGTDRTAQTLLADVETLGGDEKIPWDHIVLKGRDLLGRMQTVRADQIHEWDSQEIGGDNFEASDDTEYSGTRHTAPQEGSFKAIDNELIAVANEAPVIAFNTFCFDPQNGSAQAAIKIAATDSDDYAGLVFRAYDRSNMMNVAYVAETDKIGLYDRRGDTDKVIGQSGAMSWTYDAWYWLKVRFRYGYIWVYSSTDGAAWTQQIATEVEGIPAGTTWTWQNFAARDIPNMSGRMGYIGHGYSNEDDEYEPPPKDPPKGKDPPEDPEDQDQWIFGTRGKGVVYSNNVRATSPNYHIENTGLEGDRAFSIWDFKIVEHDDGHRTLFACTSEGIFEYENLPMAGGRWTLRQDHTTIGNAAGLCLCRLQYFYVWHMRFSIEIPGRAWAYVTGSAPSTPPSSLYYGLCIRTSDYWKTLDFATVIGSIGSNYAATFQRGEISIAQHSAGQVVYVCTSRHATDPFATGADRSYNAFFKSANGGRTFGVVRREYLSTWAASGTPNTCHVPYHSEDWNDSYVYWSHTLGGSTKPIFFSDDAGATYSELTGEKSIQHIAGPTWDAGILCVRTSKAFYEYVNGTSSKFTDDWPSYVYTGYVMARDNDSRVTEWLGCGSRYAGVGPSQAGVAINDGPSWTDKTGDLNAVLGGDSPDNDILVVSATRIRD